MNTKYFFLSLAILVLLLQPALNIARSVNAQEQPQTAVRIVPALTDYLSVGDSFTVNISAENCVDIYAVQVEIHYDPTVLRLDKITPASAFQFPFIINGSNIYDAMQNLTYNGPTYGQVYYVASRNDLQEVTGINGDVLLFTVTFTVISDGSSFLQLTPCPGGTSTAGTVFMTPQQSPTTGYVEVIPQLYSASYGQPASQPINAPASTSDVNFQIVSAQTLPYLMPFVFAALFLVVIRRRITKKTLNQ
jgi:hypothetical protein